MILRLITSERFPDLFPLELSESKQLARFVSMLSLKYQTSQGMYCSVTKLLAEMYAGDEL